ncbi:MAG: hypothetical protein EU552_01585 [Promethearchaeota archaeon]|nr:MAG: hypothetical protein EU552_01585 [Candidatus Lokiarchaeota archaeon]
MNSEETSTEIKNKNQPKDQKDETQEVIKKDSIPHFLPTFRVLSKLYPLPIITVVIISGILAYLTFTIAGVQIDGGYFPEGEYGIFGAILNGIIFTVMAAISGFILIFIIKRKGINILKYVFGFSIGFLGFFLTLFFSSIIIYVIFIQFPETEFIVSLYYILEDIVLPIVSGIFTILLLYLYFTSKSIRSKNFIVLYVGLLVGASLGVFMPLWTTLAILIGISCWDLFAVLYKKGPIKEMIDIASSENSKAKNEDEEMQEKIEQGDAVYDTSKLEIGIGDLAFYSMLTSSALVQTNNIFIMIFTAIAIIVGTGITISGLKRNKVLPGLPISIFLGIGTMLISWAIILIF